MDVSIVLLRKLSRNRMERGEKHSQNRWPCVSMAAVTINHEMRAAATVVEKIRCDLNMIALGYTILPHPIIVPPTIGCISHVSGEVVHPKVDDRVEIVDEMLAAEFYQYSG